MEKSSQAIIFYLYTLSSEQGIIKFSQVGRMREREMVSEDINATMNYSIMSTRSVIKTLLTSAQCSGFLPRTLHLDARKRLKINMTNWQIICSIKTGEQVCGAAFVAYVGTAMGQTTD